MNDLQFLKSLHGSERSAAQPFHLPPSATPTDDQQMFIVLFIVFLKL
jgi:hypothetical protein